MRILLTLALVLVLCYNYTLGLKLAELRSAAEPEPCLCPLALPDPTFRAQDMLELPESGLVGKVSSATYIENYQLALTVTEALEIYSKEFEVDLWLMASLIRAESSGNPEAVSHAGAIGLTQLMPATAAEIADELGIWDYDLTDPSTNVRMGTYYMGKLLERFEGDERAALAAYNWGPTYISKRLRKGLTLPTKYANNVLSY